MKTIADFMAPRKLGSFHRMTREGDRFRAMGLVGLVGLAGRLCSGCLKKLIDDHRPAVESTIARTQQIGASLATIPPVTKDAMTIPGPVVIARDEDEKQMGTATFIYAEDIAELTSADPPNHSASRFTRATLLTECAAIMRTGKYHSSSPSVHEIIVRSYLTKCASLKYVFVVRTRKSEPREFVGDLLAFDLATGKNLGGLALSIQSEGLTSKVTDTSTTTTRSTTVTGRTKTTKTTTTTTGYVNHDESQTLSELYVAIQNGLKKQVPGTKFNE